jgi:hypothetical protein
MLKDLEALAGDPEMSITHTEVDISTAETIKISKEDSEEIKQILIPLLVICISSTLLIMGVTGWVTQAIIRKGKSQNSEE